MSFYKVRLTQAVLLLSLVLACTACGDNMPKEETSSSGEVTLRVVTMFGGTDPNAPVYEKIMADFLDKHPNISIEDNSDTSDEQWKASVAASFSAGDEPDVLQFFTDATADQLIDMDKFVSIKEIQQIYPSYAADTYTWALKQVANRDGVERAVPTTGFWEGLYCNQDLFDRYDIPLPSDWDSFACAVEKFRAQGMIPVACSLGNVPHYWMEYLMLYTSGVDGYSTNWTQTPADWIDALERFRILKQMGAFPDNTDTISNDYAQDLFNEKKAAMILEGNWYLPAIRDRQDTIVIPFPGVPDQKAASGTVVGGMTSGFYITRRAWENPDKREAAVAFVMANTDKAAVQKYWEYGGGITTAATRVAEYAKRTPLELSARKYMQGATQIVLSTDSRMAPGAYRELIAGIMRVSDGASAKELLDRVMSLNDENGNW